MKLWSPGRVAAMEGEESAHGFRLVSSAGEMVFENLDHDFPVRIVYRPDGPDVVRPRIEGRDGGGRESYLERTECPTAQWEELYS